MKDCGRLLAGSAASSDIWKANQTDSRGCEKNLLLSNKFRAKVWSSQCVVFLFFLHHKLFPFVVICVVGVRRHGRFCFSFSFCAVSCTCSLWHQRPRDKLLISHDRITQSHAQHALPLANLMSCHESLALLSVLRRVLFGMYPCAAKGLVGNEWEKWLVSRCLFFLFFFAKCGQVLQWHLVKREGTSAQANILYLLHLFWTFNVPFSKGQIRGLNWGGEDL